MYSQSKMFVGIYFSLINKDAVILWKGSSYKPNSEDSKSSNMKSSQFIKKIPRKLLAAIDREIGLGK